MSHDNASSRPPPNAYPVIAAMTIRGREARAAATEYAGGALAAQALVKRAIDEGIEMKLNDGLAVERNVFEEVFRTDDARIGITSFLESGPGRAHFTGH